MEPRLTPLLGLACPDKAKAFRGGPVVGHHPTDSLTAGWLGGLGPAKESRSGARQAKVQVEGIAYSFCGLWISSVLACLCVTSQLNGPWFDSW